MNSKGSSNEFNIYSLFSETAIRYNDYNLYCSI